MYSFLKKILFQLDPEISHHFTLNFLKLAHACHFTALYSQKKSPITLMGIEFLNRIGLAAGLDKNGDYIDALAALGFGFIEVGTVTPLPQEGNPKPRLFRLVEQEAIINRMGFNNKGVDYLVQRLHAMKFRGVLGVNIGKGRDTPLENALNDYLHCFQRVAPYASYVTVNLSSPNTPGLRNLQHGEVLTNLLRALKEEQAKQKKYIPLVVKISPDLTVQEIVDTATILLAEKIDGVIATNTTLSREGVEQSSFASESGGVSGKPLTARATSVIKQLHAVLQDRIPIIGCGGVFSKADAQEKIAAGARLIQIYTGLIYRGPRLVEELIA